MLHSQGDILKLACSGALEPQFFAVLLKGLGLHASDLPGPREDKRTWPDLADLFTKTFKRKTRAEWERIFDGTDACVAPVLTQTELEQAGYDQRPVVTLSDTPGFAISSPSNSSATKPAAEDQGIGVKHAGWTSEGLAPGGGGEQILKEWLDWERGSQYDVEKGGLVLRSEPSSAQSKARL